MNPTIRIEVVKGPEQGRVFEVPSGGFTIGRASREDAVDCALTQDMSVSRHHARGHVTGARLVIEDWPEQPSKAGVIVQGERVSQARLSDGDSVTLGRTVLVFRLMGSAPRRVRVKLSPAIRRWAGVGLFLALLTAGAAVSRGLTGGTGADSKNNGMERAWTARCGGDLQDAMRLLRDARHDGGRHGEVEALERDCRRYAKLFEEPWRLEESLRLDEARDAWTRLALGMPEGDPLRLWVETGCVARISRQLAELRP